MGNCWAAQVDGISSETTRLGSRGINESGHLAGNSEVSRSLSLDEVKPPKVYSYAELKSATSNFRADKALGEGGFGRVFQGWVDKKTYEPSKPGRGLLVAVKKMNSESFQGLEEWQSEVNIFGSLCHPNLVKLIGYCKEDKELLLVYEFMEGGSLQNHLFGKGSVQPLSWSNRLKIALGAARGLAFLHASEKQVIYRDVKTSNILLDAHFNSKLHSSGLARSGPANDDDHVSTRVMGTFGYAAPEYIATGHLYVKSDVYCFGVVFLEMLTGLRTIDTNRRGGQHNLVDWAKPLLSERKKLMSIMDSRLEEQFPVLGAVQAAQLILKCIASDLKDRPSMKEVVETLEQIQLIQKTSNESKSGTKHPAGHPDGLNN